MRAAILALGLSGCLGPAAVTTTVGTGGDLEGPGGGDWKRGETFEVGLTWPLGPAPLTRAPPPQAPPEKPPAPAPAPSDGGIPWTEIMLFLGGGASLKGSEMGVRKYRQKKAA